MIEDWTVGGDRVVLRRRMDGQQKGSRAFSSPHATILRQAVSEGARSYKERCSDLILAFNTSENSQLSPTSFLSLEDTMQVLHANS